jgi:hypothetical protein
MPLYNKTLHEKLTTKPWSVDRVQKTIFKITQSSLDAFDGQNFWPVHPDLTESYKLKSPIGCLWFGAAGTIAALNQLQAFIPELSHYDVLPYLSKLWPLQQQSLAELNKAMPIEQDIPGYLLGEAGINYLNYKLTGKQCYLDRLKINVRENISNPAKEFMLGQSGTMLIACFLYQATQDNEWISLFRRSANSLFSAWKYDKARDIHIWLQTLYGGDSINLGLVHGVGGNIFALTKGFKWLTQEQQRKLIERAEKVIKNTAIVDGKYANWLPCYNKMWPGGDTPFLQICHGSPSMVLSFSDLWKYLDNPTQELLIKGANLVWQAGPLVKPWGICHGTAGNGWTFLKMAHLTGDDRWLMKAKQFAMHAIEQSNAMVAQYGQLRTDLWCGDLGLALYLQACLSGSHELLTLDYF